MSTTRRDLGDKRIKGVQQVNTANQRKELLAQNEQKKQSNGSCKLS